MYLYTVSLGNSAAAHVGDPYTASPGCAKPCLFMVVAGSPERASEIALKEGPSYFPIQADGMWRVRAVREESWVHRIDPKMT